MYITEYTLYFIKYLPEFPCYHDAMAKHTKNSSNGPEYNSTYF